MKGAKKTGERSIPHLCYCALPWSPKRCKAHEGCSVVRYKHQGDSLLGGRWGRQSKHIMLQGRKIQTLFLSQVLWGSVNTVLVITACCTYMCSINSPRKKTMAHLDTASNFGDNSISKGSLSLPHLTPQKNEEKRNTQSVKCTVED